MQTERKLYTTELENSKSGSQTAVASSDSANAEMMEMLREIRDNLRSLKAGESGAKESYISPVDKMPILSERNLEAQEAAENTFLRTELRALLVCIEKTKHEIAILRPTADHEHDHLMLVTFELDAIVASTEKATQSILDAAERIESLVSEIKPNLTDEYNQQRCNDLVGIVSSIYESCNFQDITGQRINKVVNILQYIEERISAMTRIWGAESIDKLSFDAHYSHREEENALLEGPQLEHMAISQDDIDKLFN